MPRSVVVAKGVDYFVPSVPDEQVTTEIDGGAYLAAKTAAMRAHATQIVVDGDRFTLSSGRWQPLLAREYYTLLKGDSGAAHGTREHDLFAGLDGR
jgi:N-acetyl-1-D-myo-inositol-2-amino-2-deoxy-alpha-D-glucopyranoside deacetylase